MVTRAVNQLPGILKVSFDLDTRIAAVTYDPSKVSVEAVRKAIEDANSEIEADSAPRPDVGRLLGTEPPE